MMDFISISELYYSACRLIEASNAFYLRSLFMKKITSSIFNAFATCNSQTPLDRLGVEAVRRNIESSILTYRVHNNILIGLNYLYIAAKYSKCYLCKFPVLKGLIRNNYKMRLLDKQMQNMNNEMFGQLPLELKMLNKFYKFFQYPNKNMFSSLALIFREESDQGQHEQQITKFISAVESITLGFELHNAIETNFKPNTLINIGLKILKKVIKDKYLVLAGDYLHIRGSVLASETNNIEISRMMAEMEINLCKYMHLKEELRSKIEAEGYKKVTIQQIYGLALMKTSQVVKCFQGMDVLLKNSLLTTYKIPAQKLEDIYQTIGLVMLYRKELESFMFNFYKILGKFIEYRTSNITFCEEYTLSHYLFYESAQKSERIDLAYLNTVRMMSEEINILERKLGEVMGEELYQHFDQRVRYIFMMYL